MPDSIIADAAAVPMPFYGFVTVEGVRAAEFLQGQLTCDVRGAGSGHVLPGACCSLKGRVLSSFLLWQPSPERFVLRLRADIVAATAALLRKYGVFSRVVITEPGITCAGILGAAPPEALTRAFGDWPVEQNGLVTAGGAALLRRDRDGLMHEVWMPEGMATLEGLSVDRAGSDEAWRAALIGIGEAEIQAATQDLFLPQMLGYDSNGTVSFRKGCYTGQEVVARTHYKGSVKRRLFRLGSGTGPCPAAGAELRADGRPAGVVLDAVPVAGGGCEVLAVVTEEALSATDAVLLHGEKLALRVLR